MGTAGSLWLQIGGLLMVEEGAVKSTSLKAMIRGSKYSVCRL